MKLFKTDQDYLALERILAEAAGRVPTRILDYCIMPNHWHFVMWPRKDGELSAFFRWFTHTHAMRWRVAHKSVGYGPVYQGRFKSLPVQEDHHLLTLCRYVERNPVTAGLLKQAQQWRWGSLWVRETGTAEQRRLLAPWPIDRPRGWIQTVNTPLSEKELNHLAISLRRSRPYGDERWTQQAAGKLGLIHTMRGEGRPRIVQPEKEA
jgi:putative transposase